MRHWIRPVWCLIFLMCSILFLMGCATRSLVLNPRIKPLDFVIQQPYDSLILIPFEDRIPESEKGKKNFREQPIDIFNDTLLTALRASQGFKRVVRGTDIGESHYQLSGAMISLATKEPFFKMDLIKSSMKVTAVCVSSFRFVNATTGAVLLEETVTTTGEGSTRITGGGQYAAYDSSYGCEESISQALSENIAVIGSRILEVLSKRR